MNGRVALLQFRPPLLGEQGVGVCCRAVVLYLVRELVLADGVKRSAISTCTYLATPKACLVVKCPLSPFLAKGVHV